MSYILQDASVSEKRHIHVVLEKSRDTETLPCARLETKADMSIRCCMDKNMYVQANCSLIKSRTGHGYKFGFTSFIFW